MTQSPQNCSRSLLPPNILIPQIGVRADELGHHRNALGVIKHDDMDSALAEQIFGSEKVPILSDDHSGNAVEQRRARAHDAGTERADQGQLRPIAPAAGVANASGFCVSRGISGLHAQIVAAGDDASLAVCQYRSDRQPAFAPAGPGLGNRFLE